LVEIEAALACFYPLDEGFNFDIDHHAPRTNRCVVSGTGVICPRMASMSTEAIVNRLARDGYGGLVTAIRSRQMTAHAAACLVGYFRRRATKSAPGDDPRSKRRLFNESALLKGMK
jgi:hypothetical protein